MTPLRAQLLLSAQRALLGAIGANWRAVWIGLSDGVVHLHPVVDGAITEEDRDVSSVAAAEMCADFPQIGPEWVLDEDLWVCPTPLPVPRRNDLELAFLRRGETLAGHAQ